MAKNNINKQWETVVNRVLKMQYQFVIPQMVQFGIRYVNEVIPSQQEFRNLTGNTTTSYAFGVYHNGRLEVMGFNKDSQPPLRNKLIQGESIYDFTDYDGRQRTYFTADIDTDGGYGKDGSISFLKSHRPIGKYSIIFTTGTEYSSYLENMRNLNVLSDAYISASSDFIKSFKPIR